MAALQVIVFCFTLDRGMEDKMSKAIAQRLPLAQAFTDAPQSTVFLPTDFSSMHCQRWST